MEEAQLLREAAGRTPRRRGRERPETRAPLPGIRGLHVLVPGLEAAKQAVLAGADVLRLSTDDGAAAARGAGRGLRDLGTWFYVVDDVAVALELGADGVHLDRRPDLAEPARAAGLRVGVTLAGSAADGVDYVEFGRVGEGVGSDGAFDSWLLDLASAVADSSVPVLAGGEIDAAGIPACLAAGAAGVAVSGALSSRELHRALAAEAEVFRALRLQR